MQIFPLDRPVLVAAGLALALSATTSQAQWQAPAYELRLRPDFEAKTVLAQATISLRRGARHEDELRLSAPELEIHNASIDGIALSPEKRDSYWLLKLAPEQAARRELTLKLDYLARAGEGLLFGADYVYTAFHTCRWLPCLGPDLGRASLKTTLALPAGYSSLASGVQLTPQPAAQQQQWLEAAPYPLYTLGFAAGRFTRSSQSAGDKQLHYLGVNDDAATLQAKFKTTPAMLTFFTDKAGLALPHPSYSQLLLPGGVAQEMSSYAAIGHKMLDPILEQEQEDWVIAHELAHQWWGYLDQLRAMERVLAQ
jgi:aminopeptidase N